LARIEAAEYKVDENRKLIDDFRNDDLFINAGNNYARVYV